MLFQDRACPSPSRVVLIRDTSSSWTVFADMGPGRPLQVLQQFSLQQKGLSDDGLASPSLARLIPDIHQGTPAVSFALPFASA